MGLFKNFKVLNSLIKARGLYIMILYLYNRFIVSFRKNILNQRFIMKDIHNYKMILDTKDMGISRALLFFGSREEDHKYLLEKELKPGMTMLDLGANIGYYALMECNLVGPEGFVYCIEPHEENFNQLKKNISLNKMEDRVEFFHLGASNKNSKEKLYVSINSNQHSFCDTTSEENLANLSGSTVEVETITVEKFIQGKKNIDLIRMDIEGFEVEVFEGMLPAIDNNNSFRPSILFETHRAMYREPDRSLKTMLNQLFNRGYYTEALISNEYPWARFKEFGFHPDVTMPSDGLTRGLYYNMKKEDVIKFSCEIGCVRGLLLKHNSKHMSN